MHHYVRYVLMIYPTLPFDFYFACNDDWNSLEISKAAPTDKACRLCLSHIVNILREKEAFPSRFSCESQTRALQIALSLVERQTQKIMCLS